VLRTDDGNSGLLMRFGRCVPNPANALLFVACVSASGSPDCNVTMPDTSHPRANAPARPVGLILLPGLNGNSQTKLATNTLGISPVDTSRSSFRLKLSATGKFATGPVRIDASNTDDASSISFDRV